MTTINKFGIAAGETWDITAEKYGRRAYTYRAARIRCVDVNARWPYVIFSRPNTVREVYCELRDIARAEFIRGSE